MNDVLSTGWGCGFASCCWSGGWARYLAQGDKESTTLLAGEVLLALRYAISEGTVIPAYRVLQIRQ